VCDRDEGRARQLHGLLGAEALFVQVLQDAGCDAAEGLDAVWPRGQQVLPTILANL
jgi:hypothetical protein